MSQYIAATLKNLNAIINSIGNAGENSRVKRYKNNKKMLKFFLDLIIKEELVDDRSSYVRSNKNTMGKA